MKEYKMIMDKGLIFIFIDGKKALIDTGSPITLSDSDFTFSGTTVKAKRSFNFAIMDISLDSIRELSDTQFDIFMGIDLLTNENIAFLLSENRFLMGNDINPSGREKDFSYNIFTGVTFDLKVSGNPITAIFDTGATISYISEELTSELNSVSNKNDFHPLIGNFETPIYNLETCIFDDEKLNTEFGNLPDKLNIFQIPFINIQAVLGNHILGHYNLFINWKTSKMTFQKIK
ncbi:MAG: retroviral-like aspartic protease family protein [Deltaproteobacteria bacterium]|nr:retroviral-like aspartic protease family protein [Deltaproteobacteria bacterium]